jgi:hypothetical protein
MWRVRLRGSVESRSDGSQVSVELSSGWPPVLAAILTFPILLLAALGLGLGWGIASTVVPLGILIIIWGLVLGTVPGAAKDEAVLLTWIARVTEDSPPHPDQRIKRA